HPLDAAAVVPAAVEDDHLAGGRQVGDVALEVPLGALALGRRGQRHDGRVTPFEDQDDLQALLLDPVLHSVELEMKLGHPLLVDGALITPVLLRLGRHRVSFPAAWKATYPAGTRSS